MTVPRGVKSQPLSAGLQFVASISDFRTVYSSVQYFTVSN